MTRLKIMIALAAALVLAGCYKTSLLVRAPISALLSGKTVKINSTIVLTEHKEGELDKKTVTDNMKSFVPDARLISFPSGHVAFNTRVHVSKNAAGAPSHIVIYKAPDHGVYIKLSDKIIESYKKALELKEAPTLRAGIKLENDTRDTWIFTVQNEFTKENGEALNGAQYRMEPGQVMNSVWSTAQAAQIAVTGQAVKIGQLEKAQP